MGSLDGRRHEDVFAIDLTTGDAQPRRQARSLVLRPVARREALLYYEDGDYHVYSLATGQARTSPRAPVSFVDIEDDHNDVKPPTAIGWASDSTSVLLTDDWDIWQVPVDGGAAVNLTVNGTKDAIRYQRRFRSSRATSATTASISSKPQYFSAYGEWTKKAGIARLSRASRASRCSPGRTRPFHGAQGEEGRAVRLQRARRSSRPTTTSPTRRSRTAIG